MTSFDSAVTAWGTLQTDSLKFGHFALAATEQEGRTIRELSIAICGNEGLEDRIGRYVMAARWDLFVRNNSIYNALYEDSRDWLTVGHYTELWKIFDSDTGDGMQQEIALDAFEQCFIRDEKSQVTEIRPVEWLRAKRQGKSKSYVDKVKSYCNHIRYDLIETPFDGLSSRTQLDAAANVRENAKRLQESLETLLGLIEKESERA